MNDTKYIKGKDKWQATRLIDDDAGTPMTRYLGLWSTKKEAENAPIPIRWDGQRAF